MEEKPNKIEAYCLRCKKKQIMKNPKKDKFANGTNVLKGTCSVCGMKLFKIVSKKEA